MRHRKAASRLNRNMSNRKALMRALARAVLQNERITTTHAKAKAARSFVDKLITLGKRNTSAARKRAIQILGSKELINHLFGTVAPRFAARSGGYTRILQLASRKGDGAPTAILELTERTQPAPAPEKRSAKKSRKTDARTRGTEKKAAGTKDQTATAAESAATEQRQESRAAHATEKKPTKPPVKKQKENEEKAEGASQKKFFKGLRDYFGKKDSE